MLRAPTQVYLDGVCHWLCKEDEEDSPDGPCLVSFYLSNDVFFEMIVLMSVSLVVTIIPSDLDDCFDVKALWINLAVLYESIALFSYHEETTTFHVSVLGELGMKESWTKLFTFRGEGGNILQKIRCRTSLV
ncbi:hypothetical protein MTR_4g094400 [Medicago truncatula]|nr:hypothetical protein MTR_4g094400 [Medicago truncatula]